jgi:hypothetical protein
MAALAVVKSLPKEINMTDEISTTDEPTPQPVAPAPVKPRGPRSAQDQADANLINICRGRLTAAQGHPDLITLLQPRGFGAAGLLDGLTACDLAQTTFNARQLAMDAKGTAAKALKLAESAARTGYADFNRIAAKVLAANPTAKAALVIPARLLSDQDKFLTNVEAAYNTALARTTYLAALGKRGYTAEAIQAELAKLKAWTKASADYDLAVQEAARTTTERKTTVKALKTWWAEFYATAQVALKDRPDLMGLLDS